MAASTVYLPNGYTIGVKPVFGGMTFKTNDLNPSHSLLPPGWSIVINSLKPGGPQSSREKDHSTFNSPERSPDFRPEPGHEDNSNLFEMPKTRFTKPTLNHDYIFISSIVFPSSSEFKPAISPTRQIALMLWATLYWYFHEPEPNPRLTNNISSLTPERGRPKGEWCVHIRREGVLKGRNLMPKLERMGLVASEDSTVGLEENLSGNYSGWNDMFVSRRSFWQIDPRIFLFTWRPVASNNPPRTASPCLDVHSSGRESPITILPEKNMSPSAYNSRGPFYSSSHLPTFFPPPPPQYVFTDEIRHPIRQKPPRQGEVFYIRYIPSLNLTLSFRVPILPPRGASLMPESLGYHRKSASASSLPLAGANSESFGINQIPDSPLDSDISILHRWMNNPRINAVWGVAGPHTTQEAFLRNRLTDRHSFPVLACWDASPIDDWDRGICYLVGDEENRSTHRVQVWLSALVHYCWLADNRTQTIVAEQRIDCEKSISNLHATGFYREAEVTFPHKQSAVMKIKRDNWEAPRL